MEQVAFNPKLNAHPPNPTTITKGVQFKTPLTSTSPKQKRYSAQDWEVHRDFMIGLRKQGRTAEQIKRALHRKGFIVEISPIKRKLREWEPKYRMQPSRDLVRIEGGAQLHGNNLAFIAAADKIQTFNGLVNEDSSTKLHNEPHFVTRGQGTSSVPGELNTEDCSGMIPDADVSDGVQQDDSAEINRLAEDILTTLKLHPATTSTDSEISSSALPYEQWEEKHYGDSSERNKFVNENQTGGKSIVAKILRPLTPENTRLGCLSCHFYRLGFGDKMGQNHVVSSTRKVEVFTFKDLLSNKLDKEITVGGKIFVRTLWQCWDPSCIDKEYIDISCIPPLSSLRNPFIRFAWFENGDGKLRSKYDIHACLSINPSVFYSSLLSIYKSGILAGTWETHTSDCQAIFELMERIINSLTRKNECLDVVQTEWLDGVQKAERNILKLEQLAIGLLDSSRQALYRGTSDAGWIPPSEALWHEHQLAASFAAPDGGLGHFQLVCEAYRILYGADHYFTIFAGAGLVASAWSGPGRFPSPPYAYPALEVFKASVEPHLSHCVKALPIFCVISYGRASLQTQRFREGLKLLHWSIRCHGLEDSTLGKIFLPMYVSLITCILLQRGAILYAQPVAEDYMRRCWNTLGRDHDETLSAIVLCGLLRMGDTANIRERAQKLLGV